MEILDTISPYREIPYEGIQYTVCADYDHISRYRALRQVISSPDDKDNRRIQPETVNEIDNTGIRCIWYEVKPDEENRLDILAYRFLGSASYSWVISYFNDIEAGFTVRSGQKILIPESITSLMQKGHVLQSITAFHMNLGTE